MENTAVMKRRTWLRDLLMKRGVVLVVLGFILFMSLTKENFLTGRNLSSILSASGPAYLCTMAMSLVMFTRCLDLSVGGNVYLCAAIGTFLNRNGWETIPLILAMLTVGLLCGLINGLITASLRVYPMLNTLAINYVFRGLAFIFTRGALAHMPQSWNAISRISFLGVPITIFLPLLLGVLLHIMMTQTRLGRHIYAVGDSEKTAAERGISVFKIKVLVYAMNGLLCGVAAILLSSQVMSVPSSMGSGMENTAMMAAVLGGVSFAGGKGKLFPGVYLGALLYATVSNAMVLLEANAYLYNVIYGCVILAMIVLEVLRNLKDERL